MTEEKNEGEVKAERRVMLMKVTKDGIELISPHTSVRAAVGEVKKADLSTFKDGEELLGTTQGYQPDRPGFFVIPADPESNNERCYVVASATEEVSFV